MNIKIICLT